ncbi:MAG TPA: metallophosphoesterase family protein [Bacteroidales bacterium]|nr:metallophosphoesterase family protein [Bacteroidales bacterium]HSA42848.1 metallophosphoesterase family protein [Bacteroidales bacterium]
MLLGLISDIHEDFRKLEQALRLCERHHCDEIACLGDIVGYNPAYYANIKERSASRCLHLIQSYCRWVVAGNHDLYACGGSREARLVDELQTDTQTIDVQLNDNNIPDWSYEGELPGDMTGADVEYLRNLPHGIIPDIGGIRCLLSHYVYPDLSGSKALYIKKRKDLMPLRDFMVRHAVSLVVTGHTHTAGAGFAFPFRINGAKKFLRAIHRMPFHTYPTGNIPVLCLLPAVTGETGVGGMAILDTTLSQINVFPIHQYKQTTEG